MKTFQLQKLQFITGELYFFNCRCYYKPGGFSFISGKLCFYIGGLNLHVK